MHGQGIARLQFAAAQTVPRCQAGVRFVLGTQVLTQEAEVHRTHSASLCTRVIAERFVNARSWTGCAVGWERRHMSDPAMHLTHVIVTKHIQMYTHRNVSNAWLNVPQGHVVVVVVIS